MLYCYPERITDELLEVIANQEKIVKYMDIPIQHCNGEILKRMNRRGNRQFLTELMKRIRNKVPDIVIRTTLITGFPGETQEQFEELAEFVKDMRFDRLGCFAYSQEEGTAAADFDGQLDEEIKTHRADIIMKKRIQRKWTAYLKRLLRVLTSGLNVISEELRETLRILTERFSLPVMKNWR